MRKYMGIFKIYFRTQLAWRFDVFLTVAFSFSKVLLAFILWKAIFAGREIVSGFTFPQMLTYYIAVAFISQLDLSNGMAFEIGDRIKSGSFSGRMVVPVNVKGYMYAQTLGAASFYALFNVLAAGAWLLLSGNQAALTSSVTDILYASALIGMGLAFMLQMHFLLGSFAFKYTEVWVFLMIKNNILNVLMGSVIPLSLFPSALQAVLKFLPFYYVAYLPATLLIGKNADMALTGIFVLAAWNVGLYLINRFAYEKLRTKYDGVGI